MNVPIGVAILALTARLIPAENPTRAARRYRVLWSSFGSGFPYDFGFAKTEDQMLSGHLQKLIKEAPDWLEEWW